MSQLYEMMNYFEISHQAVHGGKILQKFIKTLKYKVKIFKNCEGIRKLQSSVEQLLKSWIKESLSKIYYTDMCNI